MTAEELDEKFDNGEDISEYFDWTKARRINEVPQRVNIDFPRWVVNRLDRESQRLGVSRQALVKLWIAERLEKA
ncbi:MAG: type II toxin-antitoxin system BrnA family antitoxin [Pyrinomonadaceae bacterium]